MKIRFVFRRKLQHRNSIEELFLDVSRILSKSNEVDNYQVLNPGGSPFSILKNIIYYKKGKGRIVHITGDIHYMALATGKNTILTIHDIQSILKGNFFKQFYLKLFWFWLPSFFLKKITVISAFSKGELLKIIPWAKKKVVVVHNPVNGQIIAQSDGQISTPNPISGVFKILLLGTKENKNLFRTIEALSVLPCELIIIGVLNEKQKEKLLEANLCYTNVANISFQEVIQYYKQSDLVCFASTYEGFGMPIIEAQALGKPIVTSNVASMPEIAADSAILVNPYDVNSIREGVSSLMFDEKLRIRKIEEGYKNIQRFQLETICQQYLDIYKEVLHAK